VTEDERQALMDRNLAAARQRVRRATEADRAPEAVNVSRLTPTVISPACNCDELIAARETLARLTSERDALTARLQSEHETRWWATYNAALTGVLAYSGNEPPLTKSPHKESALHADAAHGPRGSK